MSELLWISEEKDQAINLGDFFELHGAFSEMTKLIGNDYSTYQEFFGVPLQASLQEDCDPQWLQAVRLQARSILHEYEDKLSERAKHIVETLIKDEV